MMPQENSNIGLAVEIVRQRCGKSGAIALVMLCVLSGCGGGSGDSNSSNSQSGLIIGGPTGGDASELSDDQIRQRASDYASAGLGVNLGSLSRLASDAQTDTDATGMVAMLPVDNGMQNIETLDGTSSSFLNNSLGVDDPGARITRSGNVIIIDPDDQSVCNDEIPLADGLNDDQSVCQQLASDLTVQIDAASAETGVITYLFQDSPVLLIGYSPMGASYEIRLGGIQSVVQRSAELQGGAVDTATVFEGTLRLEAVVLSDEPGSEAGTLALKVTDAIQLGAVGEPAGITLQPSTVFEVSTNEATQDVSMRVDWGALQFVTESGDSEGNTSTSRLNLGGLSAELDFNEEQPSFRLSNVGIGGVPLTVTIDSIESVNLTLANFGVSFDQQTGSINLDGALNTRLMLNNLAGLIDDQAADFTLDANVSAPANTQFVEQNNGSTQIISGGPVSATLIGGDSSESAQSEIMINAGECFDSGNSEDGSQATAFIMSVPCN